MFSFLCFFISDFSSSVFIVKTNSFVTLLFTVFFSFYLIIFLCPRNVISVTTWWYTYFVFCLSFPHIAFHFPILSCLGRQSFPVERIFFLWNQRSIPRKLSAMILVLIYPLKKVLMLHSWKYKSLFTFSRRLMATIDKSIQFVHKPGIYLN